MSRNVSEHPWVVIGNGNQGSKHVTALQKQCIGVIDTVNLSEGLVSLKRLVREGAKNVLIATPENVKVNYVIEAMSHGLNIAVEKPMPMSEILYHHINDYLSLGNKFQTVYDHLTDSLISRAIQEIKHNVKHFPNWTSLFVEYGFGTRNLVRKSPWQDFGPGPWEIVSPHLLKIAAEAGLLDYRKMNFEFGFGGLSSPTQVVASRGGNHFLVFNTSYTAWKNTFRLNFRYENGFIEIEGLEKWGSANLKFYLMDFSENKPRLVKEYSSVDSVSYVERLHQQIFNLDLYVSLQHDRMIWKHILDANGALYSV